MEETVTFAAQSVTGTPSEPLELSFSGLLPGDADGNGKVTVTDIAVTIDLILSNGYEPRADANQDGKVTVTDIAAIIDLVLGKPAPSRRMRTDVREAQ